MFYQTNEKSINSNTYAQRSVTVDDNGNTCRIRWLIAIQIFSTILVVLLFASFYSMSYVKFHHHKSNNSNTENNNCQKRENITTLYAFDALSSSFGFGTGEYGLQVIDWVVYNHESDLDFNNYNLNSFTVAVEGGRIGRIIDLGTAMDLKQRYHYPESVGNGQGFASIHRKNQTVYILKDTNITRTYQPMYESAQLFRYGISEDNVPVQLGHMYLIRITDRFDSTFERMIKMIVIGYQPSNSVTIRWMSIP